MLKIKMYTLTMSAIPGNLREKPRQVLKIKSPEAAAPSVCDHAVAILLLFFVFIHLHKHASRKHAFLMFTRLHDKSGAG